MSAKIAIEGFNLTRFSDVAAGPEAWPEKNTREEADVHKGGKPNLAGR
jgi:hypothetical protein